MMKRVANTMLNGIQLIVMLLAAVMVLTVEGHPQRQRNLQSQRRSIDVAKFSGRDLGTKINAADKELGPGPGDIVVAGGGMISTQIVISSGHTLRLGNGTYVTTTTAIPILLKPNSSIIGSGWDAILMESTADKQFTVIKAYNNSTDNDAADADLTIRDLQIKGANRGFESTQQAISLGNCTNCTVDHVWINGTRSIGIQLGGASFKGHFAENSKVINSQFTRVASQNLALVNGRNILFENNKFITAGQPGGPGSTNIDLEPNGAADHLQDVIIRNNLIDVRKSEVPTTGNGIVIQATSGTPYVGNILVENNTIIGGSNVGVITTIMSNGIYVFGPTMRGVTIRNNKITRTGQAGLNLEGTQLTVLNNILTDVGGGGTPGFVVHYVTNSQIIGNKLVYTGVGPVDATMLITHSSNVVYKDNNFQMVNAP